MPSYATDAVTEPTSLPEPSPRWRAWREATDLDAYDARWERMAAAGEPVHGEADAVERVGGDGPMRVLDAGCGTGRVAVELARRGHDVVGVDADPDMVERARRRSGAVRWIVADLASVDPGGRFDVVVMAGNVLPYAVEDVRPAIVANLARCLLPGGRLLSGAVTGSPAPTDYDRWCTDAGLVPVDRWATWDGAPFTGGDFAVSLHRRPLDSSGSP